MIYLLVPSKPLAIGIVLLMVIGAVSMIKKSDQSNSVIPACAKRAEKSMNPDWELCPLCGAPAGEK